MHTITARDFPEAGTYFNTFSYLYEQLSTSPLPATLGTDTFFPPPTGLGRYLELLYNYCGQQPPLLTTGPPLPQRPLPASRKVLLAFSGGKDSVACAIKLKQEYEVTLFFVRGANRSYTSELKYSRVLAEMLGLPLVERGLTVRGNCKPFAENPVKNHLIEAMMVDYGLQHGITNYAFGSGSKHNSADTINPLFSMSDAAELYEELERFYQRAMPAFRSLHLHNNNTDSYWTICTQRPDIARAYAYQSCMMPDFRRPHVRQACERRGVTWLEKSRCGNCMKCAEEYIHNVLFGMAPYNRAYLERCVACLERSAYQDVIADKSLAGLLGFYMDIPFLQAQLPAFRYDPATEHFVDAVERFACAAVGDDFR